MQQNTTISFEPLLPSSMEKESLDNKDKNPIISTKKLEKSFIKRWNSCMIDNYMILIIITFVLIFFSVPLLIFHIKKARYVHLFQDDSSGIIQPLTDNRELRWIELNNEMNIVLISDPDSLHGGAALEIDVGSSYDPEEIPGLAHFLEHMLFMGSKKYQNVSHFKDFINLNGGRSNAFTSDDYTKFYFTINNEELENALEIFSRFFIDPLFDVMRIEKEILAVHNEYEMNLQKNLWRFFELLRRNSNPKNSFHRFTCGNIKTLKILPEEKHLKIQEEVANFFKNYYSSHKMKLVLIGNQKLDILEKMAVSKFNQVLNKKDSYKLPMHLINMPLAYPSNLLGKFIWYKTIGNQKLISIVFPLIIPKKINLKVNAFDYLSNLICLEGKNSLKWSLIQKGWITNLETLVIQKTPDFLHFAVMISLSEKGIANTLEIVEEFFSWVYYIKKKGITKKFYKQFSAISYLNFFFSKKKSLEDDLINLVSNLKYIVKGEIPYENIFLNKEIFVKYDGDSIRELLKEFIIEKCLIVLGAGDIEIEKIIGTERFKNNFNETTEEDMMLSFKEKQLYDYDTENFQSLKFFTMRKIPEKHSNRFILKPKYNLISFKESILIDEKQMNFNKLMEETFTFCDYDSNVSFDINALHKNYESNAYNNRQENSFKCWADYNDSLLYYKKLNKYDEIMKIYYASEMINNTMLSQIKQNNESNTFNKFDFYLSNHFVPTNFDLKTNCNINENTYPNNGKSYFRLPKFISEKPDFMKKIKDLIDYFNENEISNISDPIIQNSPCLLDEVINDLHQEYPQKINQNERKMIVWLKTDRSFLISKIEMKIFLRINDMTPGKDTMILGLIVDIVNNKNKEQLYEAFLMKYKGILLTHQNGIEFQIGGFSDKVFLMIDRILENLVNALETLDEEGFQMNLLDVKNYYENLNKAQSLQQLQKHLNKILKKDYISNLEALKYLENLSLKDLKEFMMKIFKNYQLKILYVGNILASEAEEVTLNITKNMLNGSYFKNLEAITSEKNISILNITEKYNSVFVFNNSNIDDENNAIINYYQIGERNDADYVKSLVISTLLTSETFNFLRTEKQLGYIVHSCIFSMENIDGFYIGIQGTNQSPDVMNQFVEEFLFKFFEIISNKSEVQFQNIFKNLGQNCLNKDQDLNSLCDRLWEEIYAGSYDYEKNDRYHEKLKKITKLDIIQFFQKVFKISNKKISLQLYRNNSLPVKFGILNDKENYGNKEERIISFEDLNSWKFFQKLE